MLWVDCRHIVCNVWSDLVGAERAMQGLEMELENLSGICRSPGPQELPVGGVMVSVRRRA